MKYRVVVYRRTGVTMQTYNAEDVDHALAIRQANAGLHGVYKIELLAVIENWTYLPKGVSR